MGDLARRLIQRAAVVLCAWVQGIAFARLETSITYYGSHGRAIINTSDVVNPRSSEHASACHLPQVRSRETAWKSFVL